MILSALHDMWIIYRLQRKGVRLDLKGALLRPASPLYQATARSLPDFGIWSGRVLSVVACEHGRWGFVQARWRTAAPALDLLFIAPSLESSAGSAWLWQHLLHDLGRVSADLGAQRLFAHLPEQRHAEVEVMRQGGFAIYAQDRLYRLAAPPASPQPTTPRWQPREPVDDWGLTRLYHEVTPAVVQQAESLTGSDKQGYTGWWGGARHGCYVLRGASTGEVTGFLRLTRGERGHWLKLVLHPEKVRDAASLLDEALALCAEWPRRPLYCDVRDYEGFFPDALERLGFERLMTRMLLVRHTSASLRIKQVQPLRRALDVTPETAPTPF